jgi:hypothetical protein
MVTVMARAKAVPAEYWSSGKKVTKADEWIAIEQVRDRLDDVRRRLKKGAKGSGTTLSADECQMVLACLVDPPWPVGKPPDYTAMLQEGAIKIYFAKLLHKEGLFRKEAVKKTAEHFSISDWSVRQICKKRKRC